MRELFFFLFFFFFLSSKSSLNGQAFQGLGSAHSARTLARRVGSCKRDRNLGGMAPDHWGVGSPSDRGRCD